MKPALRILAAAVFVGALIAVAVSFTITPQYVSSAVFQVVAHDPAVADSDRINVLWTDLISRSNLSELIQRPSFNLYAAERQRLPMEDVLDQMKHLDLSLDAKSSSSFEVFFRYPDREKAQAVIQEFTRHILSYRTEAAGSQPFRLVTPANLPASPQTPDRLLFLEWGIGTGLLAGAIAAALWWRPLWSSKLIACGMAGAAAALALSFIIPDQYVSRAMLRADITQEWFSSGGTEQEGPLVLWGRIEQSRQEVLSTASLVEIMMRSTVNLYPVERERWPIGDIVREMRSNLKIEHLSHQTDETARRQAIAVSFRYPDRFKAQQVVSALVTKLTDSMRLATEHEVPSSTDFTRQPGCANQAFERCPPLFSRRMDALLPAARRVFEVHLLEPASLPETVESPNRWILALAGMGVGLWLGATNLPLSSRRTGGRLRLPLSGSTRIPRLTPPSVKLY